MTKWQQLTLLQPTTNYNTNGNKSLETCLSLLIPFRLDCHAQPYRLQTTYKVMLGNDMYSSDSPKSLLSPLCFL